MWQTIGHKSWKGVARKTGSQLCTRAKTKIAIVHARILDPRIDIFASVTLLIDITMFLQLTDLKNTKAELSKFLEHLDVRHKYTLELILSLLCPHFAHHSAYSDSVVKYCILSSIVFYAIIHILLTYVFCFLCLLSQGLIRYPKVSAENL